MMVIVSAKQGWECPKCGAIMAPDQPSCINCKGRSSKGYIVEYSKPESTTTTAVERENQQ